MTLPLSIGTEKPLPRFSGDKIFKTEPSKRVHASQKECDVSVTIATEGHTKVASFLSVRFSKNSPQD